MRSERMFIRRAVPGLHNAREANEARGEELLRNASLKVCDRATVAGSGRPSDAMTDTDIQEAS